VQRRDLARLGEALEAVERGDGRDE